MKMKSKTFNTDNLVLHYEVVFKKFKVNFNYIGVALIKLKLLMTMEHLI